MSWICFPNECAANRNIGGKARALAGLRRCGMPIPEWFVVGGGACLESLGLKGQQVLASAAAGGVIDGLFHNLRPQGSLAEAIKRAAIQVAGDKGFLAVRSSASDEDGAEHSFAGQLESYLFVPPERVLDRVAAVWRSGFSERILAYRREHGLAIVPRPPAVLVQRMVHAEVSGVAFSADPVTGRRGQAVVSAVFGLGSALVSGEADADTWHVDRAGKIVARCILEKRLAHRPDPGGPEGVRTENVPSNQAGQPALTDDQVLAVAGLVRRCAAHFGRPQDIEWAIEGGQLYLLQSRPITSLAAVGDPDGLMNLWDNSNIAESYGGVTTPLTYSFARRIYEEVYRQFCVLMAVPSQRIANNATVFHCMLGLIQGRVYYNLLNWYRVLAMLPGFAVNRRFMEQMMGVKEGLPETLVKDLQNASTTDRLKDALNLAITLGGLVRNHFTLQTRIRGFYARLNDALRSPNPPLEQARPDELAAYYRELERQLLSRWDAPLVNDFFAMIFYGVLRKLATQWCGDSDGTLQNNLLCGEGGMISAEPARRVREMAELVARQQGVPSELAEEPAMTSLDRLRQLPEFARAYADYLKKFGDRCLDELKLESATLHDDPSLLIRSVVQLAQRLQKTGAAVATNIEADLRQKAEARVNVALRGQPLRRMVFGWVLKHARARVRDRENLRFERTRLFGRVRRILLAFGKNFHAMDLLELPTDVFYLELEEILGFCEGTATSADLKGLVALRRAEFKRYATMEPPADRFETRGPVHHGNTFQSARTPPNETVGGEDWKGIGCCPGVVRGNVRVVTDPREALLKPGEILVAERTDPGWIMLFASAGGLLIERGSLLSHSAIVSREMGIPSIVSLSGITKELKTGELVEMDGSTGIVRRITP
jgi:pyruvate,water dikinase